MAIVVKSQQLMLNSMCIVNEAACSSGAGSPIRIGSGDPLPLGIHEACDGFNFAVFSRHATRMSVLLYELGGTEPIETIEFDPHHNRTGDIWHVRLSSAVRGKGYVLRADGPWAPDQGHRFDPAALLLDPYATALVGSCDWDLEQLPLLKAGRRPMAIAHGLVADHGFDWQGDEPPCRAWRDTVIYETHIRGLTIDGSSGVSHPGRYLGVIEKIPYLQALGITAVELMPVQEFREWEISPRTGRPHRNYWGYDPTALFAPKASYASRNRPDAAFIELKTMVRELHRAGIEVILDVVFNHTAEGNENGATISFRGLDNSIYYLLDSTGAYVDYTGCGNTLNCNHPVVRSLIVDCLRHWVVNFHIDGFRFDLASILGRDTDGRLLSNPPLLEQIAEDPLLRNKKLIAEAWDLGGAFQVGHFPGQRWAEWNCHFRDHVRRFWRGDPGMAGEFATRLCGSADLYQSKSESPINSVNFITCHDGFTLSDLVSYARKHNEANGEDNQDGLIENYSENNGAEGVTSDPAIEAMRLRQIKNMLATLFVSRGVPMLLGGDEFRRTQQGNNNAYCQDNATSWYDWQLIDRNAGLVRFVRRLIDFRKTHPVLSAERFYTDAEIEWLGVDGRAPEWHGDANQLGCVLIDEGHSVGSRVCLLFNAALQPARFLLPFSLQRPGHIVIDTAEASPWDAPDRGCERLVTDEVLLQPRSAVMLTAT